LLNRSPIVVSRRVIDIVRWRRHPDPDRSHVTLAVTAGALLCWGALVAALDGRLSADGVVAGSAVIVAVAAAITSIPIALVVATIGWLTAVGFATAPYGNLSGSGRPAAMAAVVMATATALGVGLGATSRGFGITLDDMAASADPAGPARRPSVGDLVGAVGGRRRRLGLVVAALSLVVLTVVLTEVRSDLSFADVLLIYLLDVVAVAVVGGFGPAVLSAAAASVCLNWFFTPPIHTLTIEEPRNLLALLLFVLVAMAVSSVVHIAARRAMLANRSAGEAHALLVLARTVLGTDDTPTAVLEHLHETLGVDAELQERVGSGWVRVASAGAPADISGAVEYAVRRDLRLLVSDPSDDVPGTLLEAGARLAGAALDRERLRTQASQAEALEAGNRMRTALLAAVSHDLRTPLASIKASVSSLRQADVNYSAADEQELLATVEDSADRLDDLIANLLDMSRLQTGALHPFVQPVAIDEVAPLALHGLPGAAAVRLDIPEDLPLLRADAGLLERALANVLSNALRYSPSALPPTLRARVAPDRLVVSVIDHGPGVLAAQRQVMFEPFQRLGDTDTATGIGLGLAVARGFVEAMGGTLSASETPGGGLTMTLDLIIASEPAGATTVNHPT
jgi:two-component system sensor histidine kinase KdpD